MNHFLKALLFYTLLAVSVTACKKVQEQNAEAAKETIFEMKAGTIEAAKAAAAATEQAAANTGRAVEQADTEPAGNERPATNPLASEPSGQ